MFYMAGMNISAVPAGPGALSAGRFSFDAARAAGLAAPLTEIVPAAPGDEAAALGFALAWALQGACAETRGAEPCVVWAAPEASFAEHGAPHAQGLGQFGLAPSRLLLARTHSQIDALWAAEQALALPQAFVICTIAPAARALGLTATRRLLLLAEKSRARCVLLRLDQAGASAAWMRWRIAAAPSRAAAREIGAPAFSAHLVRNRAGPSGALWRLEWNAHEHAFRTLASAGAGSALDGALVGAAGDREIDTGRRRAG
jgi:protein ImuA